MPAGQPAETNTTGAITISLTKTEAETRRSEIMAFAAALTPSIKAQYPNDTPYQIAQRLHDNASRIHAGLKSILDAGGNAKT